MRASTPLAAAGRQQALAATSESPPPRLRGRPQPSPPSIDLASARRRRRRCSLAAPSAVPSAKATSTTTTKASETSTPSAHPPSSAHKASSTPSSINSQPIPLDQLPRPLRDSVVVLQAPNPRATGGQTPVYVLGVSHVSKRSLDRISELMAIVRPEVAVLELCKDRVGLLLPQKRGPQLWHAPEVKLLGLPPSEAKAKAEAKKEEEAEAKAPSPPFPLSAEELLRACRCAPGAPVSTADIERDCVSLQATGLFRAVRPSTSLPPASAAPQFVRGLVDALSSRKSGSAVTGEGGGGKGEATSLSGETRMQPVLPLGEIRFKATLRELPPLAAVSWRLSSALEAIEGVSIDGKKAKAASAACLADAEARGGSASSSSATSAAGATAAALAAAAPLFRAAVKGCDPKSVSVQYEGIGGAAVEAVLRPGPPLGIRGCPETGLESSAETGRGVGIEPFVPYRGPLALTKTMRVENLADVLELELESVEDVSPVDGVGGAASSIKGGGGTFAARWPKLEPKKKKEKEEGDGESAAAAADEEDEEEEEEEDGEDSKSLFDPLIETTATWLTKEYGRYQSAAAAAAGVADGDGWRKALDSAATAASPSSPSSSSSSSDDVGLAAVQVLLGDAPASRTSKQLACGVLKALPLAVGAAVASVGAAVAVLSGQVDTSSLPLALSLDVSTPEAQTAVVAAAAVASLAALWPLVGPLIQIERFSKLSAEQIEEDVSPKEPLSVTNKTRFGGEDALMGWPGAHRAVVDERDSFMAASVFAAARGESFVPAFVLDKDADGRGVWRYAMPEGEVGEEELLASTSTFSTSTSSTSTPLSKKLSSLVLPKRGGEGVYSPVPAPRAVVAVVGTAHAAGIRRAWARLVEEEAKKGSGGKDAKAVAAAVLNGETL